MLERAKNDTTGNIGSGATPNPEGKIMLKDVYQNFKEYNFIIHTKTMTIDTSRFYGAGWSESTLFTGTTIVPDPAQTLLRKLTKGLILYNVKPGTKEGNEEDITEVVCIPEVDKSNKALNYNIQVKSKRNFLLNQRTTEQNIRQIP